MRGGVRGRKTKVGRKLLRFPPTRFIGNFKEDAVVYSPILALKDSYCSGSLVLIASSIN